MKEICNSVSNVVIHDSLAEVCAKLLYSASILERAITCCFRDQDIKLGPRKVVAHEVDLLSSTSDAQTISQNDFKGKGWSTQVKQIEDVIHETKFQ